jgi:hypothetical protein
MFEPINANQVSWQSLDPAVVGISAAGVEGLAPGVGVVEGTYGGSLSAQALVTVGSPEPGGTPTPLRLRLVGSPVMVVEQEAGFGAWMELSNGTASNVTGSTTWQSSDTGIGTFVQQELQSVSLRGVKNGTTTITATYGGSRTMMVVSVKSR